jgi:hypothetical protein
MGVSSSRARAIEDLHQAWQWTEECYCEDTLTRMISLLADEERAKMVSIQLLDDFQSLVGIAFLTPAHLPFLIPVLVDLVNEYLDEYSCYLITFLFLISSERTIKECRTIATNFCGWKRNENGKLIGRGSFNRERWMIQFPNCVKELPRETAIFCLLFGFNDDLIKQPMLKTIPSSWRAFRWVLYKPTTWLLSNVSNSRTYGRYMGIIRQGIRRRIAQGRQGVTFIISSHELISEKGEIIISSPLYRAVGNAPGLLQEMLRQAGYHSKLVSGEHRVRGDIRRYYRMMIKW